MGGSLPGGGYGHGPPGRPQTRLGELREPRCQETYSTARPLLQETWGRRTTLPQTPPRHVAGQTPSSAADTRVHTHAARLPDTHVCTLMHRPVCETAHADTRGHTAHTQATHVRHDRVGTEMHTCKTTRVHA